MNVDENKTGSIFFASALLKSTDHQLPLLSSYSRWS